MDNIISAHQYKNVAMGVRSLVLSGRPNAWLIKKSCAGIRK